MDYNFTEKDIAFFDITEPLGWGTKTTDYKEINKVIFRLERGRTRTQWLKDHLGILEGLLHTAAKTDLGEDPCCDSWSDTLAHTVGLGRHEFMRCMYEPQRLVDRANKGDYKESFSYALPYSEDYNNCEQWKHENRAAEYLGKLTARVLLEGIDGNTPAEVEAIGAVQNSFSLLAVGKVKEYLATREAIVALMKDQDLRNLIGLCHGPDNLFGDVEDHKEFFRDF